jgi:hypothetical protein
MDRKKFIDSYYHLAKPKKFCIFCGKQPNSKTKEHLIPKWLIEFTGNVNRPISVGPLISPFAFHENKTEFYKKLSFGGFVFPACEKCNQRFGELEAQVKPILTKLITYRQLSSFDINLLLDWFDKIRIGLWLGYHQYYDENYWGILPHFYISDRLGKADRALLIYKADREYDGIRFVGHNTPAFAHTPSCFTLTLNNLFIVNVSYASLFAKPAGFPYFEHIEFTENEEIRGSIKQGTEVAEFPIWSHEFLPEGNVISQIVYLVPNEHDIFPEYYDKEYVKINTLQPSRSIPLLQRENSVTFYPSTSSDLWIPNTSYNLEELIINNAIQTLEIQNSLIRRVSLSKSMPKEKRKFIRTEFSNCIKANNRFIQHLQKSK